MELKFMLFTVLLCYIAVSVQSIANHKSNARTRKLLAALSQVGDRVLSGAFGGYNKIGFSQDEANKIQAATNKLPAVYGIDCRRWEDIPEDRVNELINCFNSDAVDYAKKGGIITLSHHIPSPVSAGNGLVNDKTISNDAFASILKDGTPERKRWLKMLEKVSDGLRGYRDFEITVLYRPFHEVNGDWFWWGATADQSQIGERSRLFKLLWQDLFNFMQKKGLNNLLWVYSPDQSRGYKTDFYPGGDFVDIVGLDCYSDDPNQINGYDEMVSLGKPFAFAEIGPRTQNGQYDYDWFVNTVLSRYPKATYFMPWNDKHSPYNNRNAWKAFNNPKVVNLGELNVR